MRFYIRNNARRDGQLNSTIFTLFKLLHLLTADLALLVFEAQKCTDFPKNHLVEKEDNSRQIIFLE